MCRHQGRRASRLMRLRRSVWPRRAGTTAAIAAAITAAAAFPALTGLPASAATAGFTLTKTASPTTVQDPGQVITYTYTVSNTTGGTLTGLSINDLTSGTGALSAINCPPGALPNGHSTTCTATYLVTNADIATGAISDTATATATNHPAGAVVTSNAATARVLPATTLTCNEMYWSGRNSAGTAGVFGTVNQATGAYTTIAPLLVSGSTTALAISTTGLHLGYLTDSGTGRFYAVDLTSGTEFQMNSAALAAANTNRLAAGPDGSLWSWASNNHLYKITLSANGLSVASVTDYGLVTAGSGNGTLVQPSTLASGDIAVDGAGNVWLIASNNVGGSGQGPSWLYTVGQSSLTAGASSVAAFQVGQVAGGASSNLNNGLAFAADGQLYTSAQVGNGGESAFYRIDPATGTETLVGTSNTEPYFATDLGSCVLPAPKLTMTKSVSPAGPVHAGSVLTYTMNLANIGNATATDVQLRDFIPADTSYVAGSTTLNGTAVPDQNGQMPYVTLRHVNSAGALGGSVAAGATATVTFQVRIDDPLPATVTHVANQAVATFTGGPSGGVESAPPGQVAGQPPASTTLEVDNPSLTVVKSATSGGQPVTVAGSLFVGQTIDYSYVITNTGNVPLSAVTVTETRFTGTGAAPAVSCLVATLAPGGQETCTATYTITQADAEAGVVSNTATASGTPPSGPDVTSPASTVTIPGPADPELSIGKTVRPTAVTAAGDRLTYSFAVTNTGNVALTSVHVNETAFSGTGAHPQASCPAATLAPGEQETCTATYTITQADVDAGHVDNTATASGTPPGAPPVPVISSPPSSAAVTAYQSPVITLRKVPSPGAVRAAGGKVTYTFTVGNAGNVTLHNVTVTEANFTGTGSRPRVHCPGAPLTLTPHHTVTCTATYRATQADADQTRFSDTARAAGAAPDGSTAHATASAVVQVPPRPALALVKTASPARAAIGDRVRYTFAISNAGNITLHDVTVVEERFTGSGNLSAVRCPAGIAALAPGATVTCTASYTLTAADAAAGKVANTASAHGLTAHGLVLIIPPTGTAPPGTAAVAVLPSGVSAGLPGKPTQADALLLSAGSSLILGGLLLGSLLPARRRRMAQSS